MAERTCAVEGCEHGGRIVRGWCMMHYGRWQRREGQSGRACAIPECERTIFGRGWCSMHYQRWLNHGDPFVVKPPSNTGHLAEESSGWRGDEVGYYALHKRIRKVKGRASEHACRDCGEAARQWAYDHQDPNEKRSPQGFTYSTDPAHYIPLCVICHRAFDRPTEKGADDRSRRSASASPRCSDAPASVDADW